jgi:pyruvate,water dikinase
LWRLSRVVRESKSLHQLFDENHPRDLAKKLAETDEGRAFLEQLNEYLFDFGWRSDAVYDIADVPWRENPSIPLGNIARYINMPDEDDPMIQYERAVKHREDLTAKIRAKLADNPEQSAKFDEFYEEAQYAVPLTEDHAFYIDQMGVVLLRTFCLAVGDALVRDGVIADRSDVFFLYEDEVREALVKGGDQRETVSKRRASVEAAAQASPPGALGTPPGPPPPDFVDPFMDAIVTRLLGIKPPAEGEVDPAVIDGVAGSPGIYRGVARVVRSLDEAGDLEDGEIMVCEMTLPPWVPMFSIAGAVVSDVGGVMSHCAIVAREFGIPAVVGTVDGTTRIKTGQTITVDGIKGDVYLDGREL